MRRSYLARFTRALAAKNKESTHESIFNGRNSHRPNCYLSYSNQAEGFNCLFCHYCSQRFNNCYRRFYLLLCIANQVRTRCTQRGGIFLLYINGHGAFLYHLCFIIFIPHKAKRQECQLANVLNLTPQVGRYFCKNKRREISAHLAPLFKALMSALQ